IMKINSWEELDSILESKNGYIYNDFGTTQKWNTREFNKLHKAACYHLRQKMTPGSAEWTYYFNTLDEAADWLKSNRKKQGYINCKTCLKGINLN
ncbi:MAG: hypothetical protein ACYDIA_22110, partial [Candidatus Humimicrobiaceae bacterium]